MSDPNYHGIKLSAEQVFVYIVHETQLEIGSWFVKLLLSSIHLDFTLFFGDTCEFISISEWIVIIWKVFTITLAKCKLQLVLSLILYVQKLNSEIF